MTRRSPHTVTYKDLVGLSEQVFNEAQSRYAGAKACGTTNLEVLTHRMETARTLKRMLEKGLPGKQTDFKQLFEQVNK